MGERVMVVGDERSVAEAAVAAAGLAVVRRDPSLILCHGGDGTLLRAERWYPGVPKLPVRVGGRAQLCERHGLGAVLDHWRAGDLETEHLDMLELTVGAARFAALNDVVLRNDNPAVAVRFRLVIDGEVRGEFTGDGLVVATPFGSTGYFRSITRRHLTEGLGVAFNNCTVPVSPLLLGRDAHLRVEVVRGPASLVHDNDARTTLLREGHAFEVRRSERRATVVGLDGLRCQACRSAGDGRFNPH